MEHADARPAGLPTARDIAKLSAGVWTLRGPTHYVDLTRPMVDAPIKLLLQIEGRAEMRQGHQRIALAPHQFALIDGSKPFSIVMQENFAQVLVAIPRATARSLDCSLDRTPLSAFHEGGAETLTRDFVLSLAAQAPRLSSKALSRSLIAMAGLVAGLDQGRPKSPGDALLQRAMALIDLDLATFDAEGIAARLGVSRRHLDKLFARIGRTLSQHIWERRLQLAAAHLRGSGSASVTEIAHAVGFRDSAHFSRSFRKRFGAPPGQWRRSNGDGSMPDPKMHRS